MGGIVPATEGLEVVNKPHWPRESVGQLLIDTPERSEAGATLHFD
jgi:hypothetical protein